MNEELEPKDGRVLIDCSEPEIDMETGESYIAESNVRQGYRVLAEDIDPEEFGEQYRDYDDISSIEMCYHAHTIRNRDGDEYPFKQLLGDSWTALIKDGEVRIEPSQDVLIY